MVCAAALNFAAAPKPLAAEGRSWGQILLEEALSILVEARLLDDDESRRLRNEFGALAAQVREDDAESADRLLADLVQRSGLEGLAYVKGPQARALDPVSRHIDTAGMGLHIGQAREGWIVRGVDPNGPAAAAGVRPGERLISIDGTPVQGASVETVAALAAGPPGGSVRLELEGDGPVRTVTVRRVAPSLPEVKAELIEGEIGYIHLPSLPAGMESHFLTQIQAPGNVRSIIVDLRDHTGSASFARQVRLASMFTHEPLGVIYTQGRAWLLVPEWAWPDPHAAGLNRFDGPLVVLVDDTTSFTLFARALQDLGRAMVVGRPVPPDPAGRRIAWLSHGGALLLPPFGYISPGLHTLDRQLEPDVHVPMNESFLAAWRRGEDPDIAVAVRLLKLMESKGSSVD